jgi:hypothetical protein
MQATPAGSAGERVTVYGVADYPETDERDNDHAAAVSRGRTA